MEDVVKKHYTAKNRDTDWVRYRAVNLGKYPELLKCTFAKDFDNIWSIFVVSPQAYNVLCNVPLPESLIDMPLVCLYLDRYSKFYIPPEKIADPESSTNTVSDYTAQFYTNGVNPNNYRFIDDPNSPECVVDVICTYFDVDRAICFDDRSIKYNQVKMFVCWWLVHKLCLPYTGISDILTTFSLYSVRYHTMRAEAVYGTDYFSDTVRGISDILYKDTGGDIVIKNKTSSLINTEYDIAINKICDYFNISRETVFRFNTKQSRIARIYITWWLLDVKGMYVSGASAYARYINRNGKLVERSLGFFGDYQKILLDVKCTDDFVIITNELNGILSDRHDTV